MLFSELDRLTTDEIIVRRAFLRTEIKRLNDLAHLRSFDESATLRNYIKERQYIGRLLKTRIVQLKLF